MKGTGRADRYESVKRLSLILFAVGAVLALLIFCYMSSRGIHERRFLDVAVFLLLCSLWCLTDSALYQIYGRDTATGSVVSFLRLMLMSIPMVHLSATR